jgi:hypothetical protein
MHMKTSRKIESTSTNNQRVVDEEQFMFSLVTSHSQADDATQQNTQYEFTFMSLDLNEVINKFSALSIIIDKRNHFQDSAKILSTIFRRSISIVQVDNSQNNVNILMILRYRFKSSSRLERFLKKSSQTSYQSNFITQNIQKAIEWWHNSFYQYCSTMFEIARTTSWFHCWSTRKSKNMTYLRYKNRDATLAFSRRTTRLSLTFTWRTIKKATCVFVFTSTSSWMLIADQLISSFRMFALLSWELQQTTCNATYTFITFTVYSQSRIRF